MYSGFFSKVSKIGGAGSNAQELSVYELSDLFAHFLIQVVGIVLGVVCFFIEILRRKNATKCKECTRDVMYGLE